MGTLEDLNERIASLKRVKPAEAESYVKSIGRQVGEADAAVVAAAIVQLLGTGKPFKVKDVARAIKSGPAALISIPATPTAPGSVTPVVTTGVPDPDDDEPPHPAKEPDAEQRRDTRFRFEQWAKNQKCEANLISAVHGISMAEVARAEGLPPSMGQSPFALARGQMFEARLFRNSAERLIPELARHELLPGPKAEFRDFRLRMSGGSFRTLDEARAATDTMLREVAGAKAAKTPIVAAGATIRIPGGGMLPEAILVVDALVVRRDLSPVKLVVGEVKTYPDRAGYTDAKELAVARAQAGVYVQGLRLVLAELGVAGQVKVETRGFLILSRPGFNAPSVRAGEDLEYQASRAERGFEKLRKAAATLPPRGKDLVAVIRAAGTAYGQSCLAFCDLAPRCWERSMEAGDPAILGDDVARWVGLVGLHRTLELLDGRKPQTPAEEDLVRRIEDARLPEMES